MKKILCLILGLVLSSSVFSLTYEARIGLSNDFLEEDALYFNIGLDIYGEQKNILQPGIGFIFADFVGDTDDSNVKTGLDTRFDRFPIFGIAKFNLLGVGDGIIFLKAFGGWQFISKDNVDGGPYYGYGLGLDLSNISIEYYVTKENIEVNGVEHNNTFGTIGFGYYYR